jgi:hypothetical protein
MMMTMMTTTMIHCQLVRRFTALWKAGESCRGFPPAHIMLNLALTITNFLEMLIQALPFILDFLKAAGLSLIYLDNLLKIRSHFPVTTGHCILHSLHTGEGPSVIFALFGTKNISQLMINPLLR